MFARLLTIKNGIIVILALLLIFGGIHSCNINKQKNDEITQLQLEKQGLEVIVNAKNQKIVEQEVIVTHSTQAIKELTDSIFDLKRKQARQVKNVIAYYKGITQFNLDNVSVPYIDSLNPNDSIDLGEDEPCDTSRKYYNDNFISVPRTAKDSTSEYYAKIEILRNDVKLTLQIPDSQYIRFVTMKGGPLKRDISGKRHFWLKRKIVVQVLHTNKLITVTGQQSAIYTPPKRPQWVLKAALIGVGVFIGAHL